MFLAVDGLASASGCVAVAALLQRVVLTLGMDLSWLLLVCNVVDLYLAMLVVGCLAARAWSISCWSAESLWACKVT
jgi:hypothetical protein